MISISVGVTATLVSGNISGLVVTGLIDGLAFASTPLSASLSDATPITSFAWGSAPGLADYGSASILIVPAAASGSTIYLSVQSSAGQFELGISVAAAPPTTSMITAIPNGIAIEMLAALPSHPALDPIPGTDTIIVETV